MSKLLKLKRWLTIEESVKYLSEILEEEISLKDIIQLIIDGNLILSVKFNNPHTAQIGKIVDYSTHKDIDKYENPNIYVNKTRKFCLELEEKVTRLEGVWDLLMYGGDKVTLEGRYLNLIGGNPNSLPKLCDVIVKKNNRYARLIVDQEYNPGSTGSVMYSIRQKRLLKESGGTNEEMEELKKKLGKYRESFNNYRENAPIHVRYYNSAYIPSEVIEVIKVDQLLSLLSKIKQPQKKSSKKEIKTQLHTKERHSYLILIAALCHKNNIDPQERGVAGRIKRIAESYGTPISEDTVRNLIKDLPEAIMTRQE